MINSFHSHPVVFVPGTAFCRATLGDTSLNAVAFVTRPIPQTPSQPGLQTLVLSDERLSRSFRVLTYEHGCYMLGPQVPMFKAKAIGKGQVLTGAQAFGSGGGNGLDAAGKDAPKRQLYNPGCPVSAAAYEPRTNAVYFFEGCALMRLDPDGGVAMVAGHPTEKGAVDGPADSARFSSCVTGMAADGEGGLVVADGSRLRRVLVWAGHGAEPAVEADPAEGAQTPPDAPRPCKLPRRTPPAQGAQAGPASCSGGDAGAPTSPRPAGPFVAQVSTLWTWAPPTDTTFSGVAVNATTGAIIAATRRSIWRLPLPLCVPEPPPSSPCAGSPTADGGGGGSPTAAQAAARQPQAAQRPPAPLLLAGPEHKTRVLKSSCSTTCRFDTFRGIALDGTGDVAWVTDRNFIHRVELTTGDATTLPIDMPEDSHSPVVLPNGCLAVCSASGLQFLFLGAQTPPALETQLTPPRFRRPAPLTYTRLGPGDDATVDPTADVVLRMSDGSRFAAHRAVLAAASEYFRARFFGAAAVEGRGTGASSSIAGPAQTLPLEVTLPDADPGALAVALRHCYSVVSARCPPPAHELLPARTPPSLLRTVAELADRLLLPDLLAEATRRLLASAWPATVVDDMLWAEAHAPGCEGLFGKLLEALRAFHVRHAAAVAAEAPESVTRLAQLRPELLAMIHMAAVRPSR